LTKHIGAPPRQLFPGRHRGWVVDANLLDLDSLDDEFIPTPNLKSPAANQASGIAEYPLGHTRISTPDFG